MISKSAFQFAGLVRATLGFYLTIYTIGLDAAESDRNLFLKRHCSSCHNSETREGGLDLTTLGSELSDIATQSKWVRVHDRVNSGEMPPRGAELPAAQDRKSFLVSLSEELVAAHTASKQTVLRRLNRYEYERTLNALLGTTVSVANLLPEDGKAYGFDNIGEALDLSPVQMQSYLEAAGQALDAAANLEPRPLAKVHELRFDSGRNEKLIGEHWHRRPDGAVVFYLEGGFPGIKVQEFRIPRTGHYGIRIHAAAHQSEQPVTYAVHFGRDSGDDPAVLHSFREARPGSIAIDEFRTTLNRDSTLRLYVHGLDSSINNRRDIINKTDKFTGPGLAVLKIEVEGPLIDEWPGKGHRLRFGDLPIEDKGPVNQRDKSWYKPQWRLVSDHPVADVEKLLPPFVAAAFRRPVDAHVAEPFISLAKAELERGATLEQALRTAQVAVLCAPDFLYLFESPGRLDDHSLAARLSYMMWGLPPDDELLKLAASKELANTAILRQQTERLLSDSRARQFTRNFVGQWLNLRDLKFTTPDKQLYPEFDAMLEHSLLQETELFFEEVLANNLSVMQFIDSDWTLLNERLAQHYGITGVIGLEMRRVALKPEQNRGGVLTHASVLKVSANGTTTSPVTRGIYVLERILGITPPPPPPGVPGVEPDIRGATTLREQLSKHRSDSACNACHRMIDPPGFALENYDVIGGWRQNYRSLGKDFPKPNLKPMGGVRIGWRIGPVVDATGETPEGDLFENLKDYKQHLLNNPKRFARVLAEKLAIYASGRGMGFSDRAELDRITQEASRSGYGFRELVHEVVQSELFRSK